MADFELVLDTLDELPDDTARALYKEKDGKFQLDLNAYGEFVKAPVVAKNKELLGKVTKSKDLAAQLEKFKDIDDESLDAFRQWRETRGHDAPEIAQREKKLKEAHARELSEREARIQAAEARLSDYVLDTEIVSWGAKYKADPDARKALLKLARDHFRLDEKGKVIAVDEDGDPLPESAEEFFANKFKSANKYLFLSDETGGSGPTGNAKPSGRFTGLKKSSMDAAAVAKFIREHGGEAYKALPA